MLNHKVNGLHMSAVIPKVISQIQIGNELRSETNDMNVKCKVVWRTYGIHLQCSMLKKLFNGVNAQRDYTRNKPFKGR